MFVSPPATETPGSTTIQPRLAERNSSESAYGDLIMQADRVTEAAYSDALKAIGARGVAPSIRAMLSAHAYAPDQIVTMRLLGNAAGFSQRHTNTLYGQFAGRVRRELGLSPPVQELSAIATGPAAFIDAAEEFSFRLRPPFARALMRSGLVRRPAKTRAPSNAAATPEDFYEGTVRRSQLTRWERDRRARAACIAYFGNVCQACGFSFERCYGSRGQGFIEVHHAVQYATLHGRRRVDPKVDLVPLCSNCHRMVHRDAVPIGVAELRKIIKVAGANR